MKILFIGYWAFNDGLTSSTILPHLGLLSEFPEIDEVVFTSIERDASVAKFPLDIAKVSHVPLYSIDSGNVLLNKVHDFTAFPRRLEQICKQRGIDRMICRGAPAGALGYLVWRRTGIPFVVESFEPHADYMLESGVWKRWDPRFLLERYWEEKQKEHATHLLPVAHRYKHRLVQDGVGAGKIEVIPCTVDLEKFVIDEPRGAAVRRELGIAASARVGIYVGKFGGLYYRDEAFRVFASCGARWGDDFHLIVLSPDPSDEIRELCRAAGLSAARVTVKSVTHEQVPQYLNAADFAFTFYKPGPSKQYLSPIKIGEYWACGLPVVISDGIGDDSEIVTKEAAGVVLGADLKVDFQKLETLLRDQSKQSVREVAIRHRNPDIDRRVYRSILFG